jgi:hypothetical protein
VNGRVPASHLGQFDQIASAPHFSSLLGFENPLAVWSAAGFDRWFPNALPKSLRTQGHSEEGVTLSPPATLADSFFSLGAQIATFS